MLQMCGLSILLIPVMLFSEKPRVRQVLFDIALFLGHRRRDPGPHRAGHRHERIPGIAILLLLHLARAHHRVHRADGSGGGSAPDVSIPRAGPGGHQPAPAAGVRHRPGPPSHSAVRRGQLLRARVSPSDGFRRGPVRRDVRTIAPLRRRPGADGDRDLPAPVSSLADRTPPGGETGRRLGRRERLTAGTREPFPSTNSSDDAVVPGMPDGAARHEGVLMKSLFGRACGALASGVLLLVLTAAGFPANPVDEAVSAALASRGADFAERCTDEVFVRRLYLDMLGTLPRPRETEAFLRSTDPDKRAALVDQLFQREEYADYWSLRWGDVLRIKSEFPINLWPNAVQAYHRWIREALHENLPLRPLRPGPARHQRQQLPRSARELLPGGGCPRPVVPGQGGRPDLPRNPPGIVARGGPGGHGGLLLARGL